VLLLNTGFEAVGRYAPIDIQDINISIGKENLGLQQWLKCKASESVASGKKAVDDLREQEKKEEKLSSITAEPKRKIYDN
jgi:hypothetical protein